MVEPSAPRRAAARRPHDVAGATVIREERYGDVLGHVVMQDPEGNEFYVA
ncbi:VOC family protein [Micromonospora matsumotoense]